MLKETRHLYGKEIDEFAGMLSTNLDEYFHFLEGDQKYRDSLKKEKVAALGAVHIALMAVALDFKDMNPVVEYLNKNSEIHDYFVKLAKGNVTLI